MFSPLLIDLFQEAFLVTAVDLGEDKIRSGAVFLAFLGRRTSFTTGSYQELFGAIPREELIRSFHDATQGSVEQRRAITSAGPEKAAPADGGFLAKYCQDFTERAKGGGIDPVFGRDHESAR